MWKQVENVRQLVVSLCYNKKEEETEQEVVKKDAKSSLKQ